jgi:hypothetical protein
MLVTLATVEAKLRFIYLENKFIVDKSLKDKEQNNPYKDYISRGGVARKRQTVDHLDTQRDLPHYSLSSVLELTIVRSCAHRLHIPFL